MVTSDFSDATLLLVGHGSTVNAASAAPTYRHAEALRCRQLFAQVRECFWKQAPGIADVRREITTPRLFVVPLFISEGYFTHEIIPRELGIRPNGAKDFARAQRLGGQTLYYCGPIGTHERMTDVLLARASEVVAKHPFPRAPHPSETTLFIAGHGTDRNENSRKTVERQVELIRGRRLYAEVQAVFLEEEPRIGDCYRLAGAKNIVLAPFFISDGLHADEDIPVLLGEPAAAVRARLEAGRPTWRNPTERHGKRLWYAPGIGSEPLIAEVILERVREMLVGLNGEMSAGPKAT